MKDTDSLSVLNRRKFITTIALGSTALFWGFGGIFKLSQAQNLEFTTDYQCRSVSVSHLTEIKKWLEKLAIDGQLSNNETYRSYIEWDYMPDKIVSNARSILMVSLRQKIVSIDFQKDGQTFEILIPTGYVDDGITVDDLKQRLRKDLDIGLDNKLELADLPLKTLAVRSGLAQYGRNNISFVKDYGSNHQLLGFYTDMEMEDHWGPLKMMQFCKGCTICINNCPEKCIGKENFVIDVGKCITLFNERKEPIPDTIDPKSHHALVGCLKCQWPCPANEESNKTIDKIASLTEEETEFLLSDSRNKSLHQQIINKLIRVGNVGDLDYLRRNFKLAFNNITNPNFKLS